MQPTTAPERFKDNPNPKWEVPQELIEWQPAYHQKGAIGVSGARNAFIVYVVIVGAD